MDTDDLTNKTYNAILGEAEKFHHDLTLQFGLLSGAAYFRIMLKSWEI